MPASKIAVVGPFACGKTDLVQALASDLNYTAVLEPVKEWMESGFLGAQYEEEEKYSLPFQQYAFSSRLLSCLRAPQNNCVYDSHVSVDPIYMRMKVRRGALTEKDFDFYSLTFDNWKEIAPCAVPDLVIYLRCSPETCMQRKMRRDREEEKRIERDYFVALNEEFEKVFGNDPNVVVLDAEQGREEVLRRALEAIRT